MNTLATLPVKRSFPKVKGNPVLGSMLAFRKSPIDFLESAWKAHGDAFIASLGPRKLVVVSHPKLASEVLIERKHTFKRSNIFEGGTPLTYVLGLSLITTDGESWLAKRRLMQPIFHRQRIAGMGDTMVAAGQLMLANWEKHSTNPAALNFSEEMKTVTLDIINRTMFSTNVLPEIDKIGQTIDNSLTWISGRITNPIQLPARWPTPANRRFWGNRALMDAYLYKIIRDRRAEVDAGRRTQETSDLLDMLLAARDEDTGAGMNDEQVRNEVAGIYGAGHETTAIALTWTWHMLNQHPEALAKLQAEVDRVLESGRAPTMADLPNLPYTLACIEETMRLYPPVPLTVRVAYEDTQLDGIDVPKYTASLIAIRNIHRHPDFWPDADTFKPERFLPENKSKLNRNAYMPFLTGPHMCIGNHFALMEGQLLLAMIARHYVVRETPNQTVTPQVAVTMRPKGGLWVTLEKR
ncbi:MAG: cytochrome P450 [Anaerolineae bacterium]|nr:cytochrome P450 [Anaerolineae bacterium]